MLILRACKPFLASFRLCSYYENLYKPIIHDWVQMTCIFTIHPDKRILLYIICNEGL